MIRAASPRFAEIAVQRGLRNAGLGGDLAEAAALLAQQAGVVDLVGGVRPWPTDLAAGGFGDRTGVRRPLGGERARARDGIPAERLALIQSKRKSVYGGSSSQGA